MNRNSRTSNTSAENYSQDNTILIEWVSAIYGIFWGVWLGFFTDKLVTSCSINPLINIPEIIVSIVYSTAIVSLTILITVYSFYLVKWLWMMRTIVPKTDYRTVLSKLGKAAVFLICSVIPISGLSFLCSIGWQWLWMGVWATTGWLFVVSLIVMADRKGWK